MSKTPYAADDFEQVSHQFEDNIVSIQNVGAAGAVKAALWIAAAVMRPGVIERELVAQFGFTHPDHSETDRKREADAIRKVLTGG